MSTGTEKLFSRIKLNARTQTLPTETYDYSATVFLCFNGLLLVRVFTRFHFPFRGGFFAITSFEKKFVLQILQGVATSLMASEKNSSIHTTFSIYEM